MSFTLRDLAAGRVPGIGQLGGGAAASLTPREGSPFGAPSGLSSSRFDEEEHEEEHDDEEGEQQQSASELQAQAAKLPARDSIFVRSLCSLLEMDSWGVGSGHRVIMVQGGTGSGKSSQIPQILLDNLGGPILCTQPRRLAAASIAQRVAEERGCQPSCVHIMQSGIGSAVVFRQFECLLNSSKKKLPRV